jgi:hypothetical protein
MSFSARCPVVSDCIRRAPLATCFFLKASISQYRRRVQQVPKLVCDEPMPAQTICLYVHVEVLDPILALSASCAELVELLRFVGPGGNDEAGVCPLVHRLGLVEDPARMLPACGTAGTFAEEPHLLAFSIVSLFGLGEQVLGHLSETWVGYEPHRVGDVLLFAAVVEGRNGEAGVRLISTCTPGQLSQ